MTALEEIYQQMTDKEHILKKPDTYMGSVEITQAEMWVFEEKIIKNNINYIPGLYKIFDEVIVNCRDHVERMKTLEGSKKVTEISISIDVDGTITMTNNGNGIDVEIHPTYNIWIPEMIFANLRSSTNYTSAKSIIGGKNGYGVKIAFIWSSECSIETVDHIRGKKYCQRFANNLDDIFPPTITNTKSGPYTTIRFKPDYKRFGLDGMTPDILRLFQKRVYDIAAVTDKTVKVKLDNKLIPIQSFKQYIELYVEKHVHEGSDHWEYAVAMSSEFTQVSFVNGISTGKGGRHVDFITNQITKKLCEYIEKKKKVKVTPASIKEQLFLFLRCNIVNPTFDSQTKDYMETSIQNFGSTCTVSAKFIEKVANLGIMDMACTIAGAKEAKTMKKTDGTKTKIIRGIAKLTDANFAGTAKSSQCIIVLCEGDSAKASILSGLTVEDKDTIGVYPLKGKVMNVRGEPIKKVMENKEISEFKRIIGLETGKKYTLEDVHKHLRYGKIWILCDQDSDGSHIKGLCINMFHTLWPSLTEIPHFINFMNTPIIKCTKGQSVVSFYNPNEFRLWKEANSMNGWHTKWYKGLGTSDRKEFAKYLKERKIVRFEHSETCDETIDMIFNKKRAENRKEWLASYDRTSCLDTSKETVTFTEFIHKEFKHFSNADNDRSIPSLVDGLKESQRKVLFGAFKRNLTVECKVSQISGYISEHSCYHHGEMSLNQTIVGMAQDFVGSNNINLLSPRGQFGTRMKGGKDSASPRYIFTVLNPTTRQLFPKDDDNILEYLEDDGIPIEPRYYIPIIPMILVNGAKGIGTGYSTDIPCFNPLQIVAYIKSKLRHEEASKEFIPYYKGFKGTIEPHGARFLIKGKYVLGDDKLEITELPVGVWSDDYKEYLESLTDTMDKEGNKVIPIVKDYNDLCNDLSVHFVITLHKGKLAELIQANTLEKTFKLATTQSISNMHLFNGNGDLVKYSCASDIIDDYFGIRYTAYEKRKQYLIEKIRGQLLFLENRVKYIHELLNETIKLQGKRGSEIENLLEEKGYDKLGDTFDYKYLTRMYMDSVSLENVEKINKELKNKRDELEILEKTTVEEWWLRELAEVDFSEPEIKPLGKRRKLIIKD